MRQTFNATDLWQVTIETAGMLAEAQLIVAMRLGGLAGVWNVARSETGRMWSEKVVAAQASALAAASALMFGAGPAAVALAAIRPVRRKTAANLRRLRRRGYRRRPWPTLPMA